MTQIFPHFFAHLPQLNYSEANPTLPNMYMYADFPRNNINTYSTYIS